MKQQMEQPEPMTAEGFSFSTALTMLKKGRKIRRRGWLSPNYYIYLDERMPYSIIKVYDKFQLSDEDLLAHDWIEKEDNV